VVLDIFSRYVVGWMLATQESASLAERLLADSIRKQSVERDQLVIHADRGTSLSSKSVAVVLADLGVSQGHSRPYCSNDNPYSEAQFKTLKYRPEFPDRFGSSQDARAFCQRFSGWTTMRTGTPASATTRQLTSTTAGPVRSARRGPWC